MFDHVASTVVFGQPHLGGEGIINTRLCIPLSVLVAEQRACIKHEV